MPSEEEAMLDELKERKIPINEIQINQTKIRNIQERAAALLARDVDLKQRAQRCFKTYLKSVYFMKNKLIFNVKLLDFESYSSSLGLEVSPRLRFFEKDKEIRDKMKKTRLNQTDEQDDVNDQAAEESVKLNDEDSDDEFMTLKRKLPCDDEANKASDKTFNFVPKKKLKPVTKQSLAKKLLKRGLVANNVKKFTDEDEESDDDLHNQNEEFNLDVAKKKLAKQDEKDKKAYKEMMRRKMLESKGKLNKEDVKDAEEAKRTRNLIDELPDPDKIYKSDEHNEDDDNNEEDDNDDNEDNEEDDNEDNNEDYSSEDSD